MIVHRLIAAGGMRGTLLSSSYHSGGAAGSLNGRKAQRRVYSYVLLA